LLFQGLPLAKISQKFIHNFLRDPAHSQRDRQTNKPRQKHNLLGESNYQQMLSTDKLSNSYSRKPDTLYINGAMTTGTLSVTCLTEWQ